MWFTYSQLSSQCLISSMTFVSPVVPEDDCRQDNETPAQMEVKRGTGVSSRRIIPDGPVGVLFTSLSHNTSTITEQIIH